MRYAITVGMIAILVALAGCGGGGKSPSEQVKPAISVKTVPPDSDGGPVEIDATINDPNGILVASATVEAPDGSKSNLNMSPIAAHTYTAYYTAAPNTSNEPVPYSVVITAVNRVGNSTVTDEHFFYVPTAWFTTVSGAKYRDTEPGVEPAAQAGDTLSMYYEGRLDDEDGNLFECNFEGHNPDPEENPYYFAYLDHIDKWVEGPFTFTVGTGQVIQGWDEGVPGMKTSGVRELEIPPELAYGDQEKPNIPANSTLHFTILLDSVGE